jgi:hypothetical protein
MHALRIKGEMYFDQFNESVVQSYANMHLQEYVQNT